jgi:hypothetical protein
MSAIDTGIKIGDALLTGEWANGASEATQGNLEGNASDTAHKVNENARTGIETAAGEMNAQMETNKGIREMQNAMATDAMITNITNKCSEQMAKLGA